MTTPPDTNLGGTINQPGRTAGNGASVELWTRIPA